VDELFIAHNPDPDSTLPYLLRVPLGVGLVFRTSGTWPRTKVSMAKLRSPLVAN
jgi:hypothetical protein